MKPYHRVKRLKRNKIKLTKIMLREMPHNNIQVETAKIYIRTKLSFPFKVIPYPHYILACVFIEIVFIHQFRKYLHKN